MKNKIQKKKEEENSVFFKRLDRGIVLPPVEEPRALRPDKAEEGTDSLLSPPSPLLSRSLQTTTPSAFTLRCRRQPEPTRSRSSPKWTIAKVTENKYPSRRLASYSAGEGRGGGEIKCLISDSMCDERRSFPPSIRSGSV